MCLEINHKLHQLLRIPIGNLEEGIEPNGNTRYYKPIIAEEDLRVYKLLKKPIFGITKTPHMKKVLWFRRGIIRQKSKLGLGYSSIRYHGYHGHHYVNKGIHSFVNHLPSSRITHGEETFIAVIPKGSRLYIGRNGDAVSTELIVFRSDSVYNKYCKTHNVKDLWSYL